MKRSVKSITGFTLAATDGEIGKVKEFYFDDDTWTIRYLIVDTGTWLSGRVVLISPEALLSPDWENRIFPINLSKDQVMNSPDINTDIPVSRQEEIELHKYYPWMPYWGGGYYGGNVAGMPLIEYPDPVSQKEEDQNKHLRSTHKVIGYKIKAKDGEIGDVEDFLFNDSNWKIDFMLIDTGHWFPGKKILISLDIIKEINWASSAVIIDTVIAHVKSSPEYNPKQELTEVYTLALHDHYNSLVM